MENNNAHDLNPTLTRPSDPLERTMRIKTDSFTEKVLEEQRCPQCHTFNGAAAVTCCLCGARIEPNGSGAAVAINAIDNLLNATTSLLPISKEFRERAEAIRRRLDQLLSAIRNEQLMGDIINVIGSLVIFELVWMFGRWYWGLAAGIGALLLSFFVLAPLYRESAKSQVDGFMRRFKDELHDSPTLVLAVFRIWINRHMAEGEMKKGLSEACDLLIKLQGERRTQVEGYRRQMENLWDQQMSEERQLHETWMKHGPV